MIISQKPTKSYRNGWNRVFGKKDHTKQPTCQYKRVAPISEDTKTAIIKAAGLDINKIYECTAAPIEGKIVNVTIRCASCREAIHNGRRTSQCPVFFHLSESPTTPLKRDQIKEVVSMNTATITQPVTANKTQIPVDTLLSLVKIIEDFVEAEQMFTCWDVTKMLTNKGFKVFHSQVKEFVHGLKVNGSAVLDAWNRNTHTFYLKASLMGVTNPMTAEVYAPSWLNLSDYDPYAVSDGSTPTTTPSVARSPITGAIQPRNTIVPSTTQKNTGSTVNAGIPKSVQRRVAAQTVAAKVNKKANRTSRDARGRLCIPNAMVRKMGLKAGDIAYIHDTGFGLTVRTTTLPGQKYITSLKVDKDDNVRITRKTLDKAGVARCESSLVVSIDSNGTSVIITR